MTAYRSARISKTNFGSSEQKSDKRITFELTVASGKHFIVNDFIVHSNIK